MTLNEAILIWREKVGRKRAIARLVNTEKIAPSTAEQIVDGRYGYQPKSRVKEAILEELQKDGIILSDFEKEENHGE